MSSQRGGGEWEPPMPLSMPALLPAQACISETCSSISPGKQNDIPFTMVLWRLLVLPLDQGRYCELPDLPIPGKQAFLPYLLPLRTGKGGWRADIPLQCPSRNLRRKRVEISGAVVKEACLLLFPVPIFLSPPSFSFCTCTGPFPAAPTTLACSTWQQHTWWHGIGREEGRRGQKAGGGFSST